MDDDGPGVPAPQREHVFERFARGDGAGEGSGLGLALVRQQARLHGGEARVEDSSRGGARFVVEIATDTGADASAEEEGRQEELSS